MSAEQEKARLRQALTVVIEAGDRLAEDLHAIGFSVNEQRPNDEIVAIVAGIVYLDSQRRWRDALNRCDLLAWEPS